MKKLLLLFAILVLAGGILHAQERRVSGTVVDAADGSSLPGVTVMVKGTTIGTVTDLDGRYELRVTPDATLVFSFIGMVTREIRVGDQTVINVSLEADIATLQETVVVGYGVQQRRDVSGAISSVSGDAIRTIPIQSFDQALQGKAAGVSLTLPNAVLGNPPVIRIRGINSISGDSSPLYIVDGVPIFSAGQGQMAAAINPLADISPSDIESIEVLKDASATAIYGSRAANGVILITTRRGKEGDLRVSYDVNTGWSSLYNRYELVNAEQYVHVKNTARANAGLSEAYFLAYDVDGNLVDTDWYDYVYQTGFQQSHSLSVSGGTAATKYYFGANFQDTEGIIITNEYTRKNARMNIDHNMTDWLSFSANLNYSNSYTNSPQTGSRAGSNFATAGLGRLAIVNAPVVPAFATFDEDGNFIRAEGDYNLQPGANTIGRLENNQSVGFFHPVWLQDHNYSTAEGDRIIGNLSMQIEPLAGLVFRSSLGIDNNSLESKQFWAPGHGDGYADNGNVFHIFDRRNRWNWTNTLNYMFTAADNLNVNILLGSEEQHSQFNGWGAARYDLGDPFFRNFQGNWLEEDTPATQFLYENYFISFFSRINMNWDSKYFLELSGRRDGYSGLADGNKFGNFGGASLMWNLSREGFFTNSNLGDFFSDLRLKASYGKVGNISGVSSYASLFLYGAGLYNNNATLFFNQAGNAELEWETSNKIDFGLSFGILNDRLQFDLGYYQNDIDGLILDVPQSPSKGIPGNVLPQNIGSMMNQGYEFTLTSYNLTTRDFSWVTDFNITYLKNEVTALADGIDFLVGTTHLETTNRTLVGYPIGMIWGIETLGVCPDTGRRMFRRPTADGSYMVVYYGHAGGEWEQFGVEGGWRDADGNLVDAININDDGVALGSPIPKFYGGFDNSIRFKNWDMNLGLTFALDFYVYNGSLSGLRDHRPGWNYEEYVYHNYWREPGDETDIPRPVWGDNVSNGNTLVQSQNVERGDYLKVRNFSIGYTLRNDFLRNAGISSARVYMQVFNALTITGYSGTDPEISSMGGANLTPGIDRNTVPQARTISFGANISF